MVQSQHLVLVTDEPVTGQSQVVLSASSDRVLKTMVASGGLDPGHLAVRDLGCHILVPSVCMGTVIFAVLCGTEMSVPRTSPPAA